MQSKLKVKKDLEFSNDERDLLCVQFKLSLLDPTNHPLPVELKDKAWRAVEEDLRFKKRLNRFQVQAEQAHLADICKVKDVAEDIKNKLDEDHPIESLELMLIDQLAALHKASMAMLSRVYDEDGFDVGAGEKCVNLSNKLMRTYQTGLQTMNQLKNSGKQTIVVKHQNVQVNGGQAIIATEINAAEGG